MTSEEFNMNDVMDELFAMRLAVNRLASELEGVNSGSKFVYRTLDGIKESMFPDMSKRAFDEMVSMMKITPRTIYEERQMSRQNLYCIHDFVKEMNERKDIAKLDVKQKAYEKRYKVTAT
jgi:hypothetical protein